MIAFSCSRCGQKFKVKPEFAGRPTTCPTCKQPLTVPASDRTQAFVPKEHIDGSGSSLVQAGVHADVTLPPPNAGTVLNRLPDLLARQAKKGNRYVIEGEVARGGMGAILRAVDCDIRREVAVKFLLDQADAKKKARFVEEAQITGQLEHPNIVPIHELGVDAQKRLFFSMKMVRGRSLAEVLDELRNRAKNAEKEWSLTRLLNTLVGVCNALAYAHARGVVHRDLKPANIMIGDFGEVYVMDWGLAKVSAQGRQEMEASGLPHLPVAAPPSVGSGKISTNRESADLTQEGSVLGTPAYMPPEQALGHLNEVDARSDIYSLGAILYEMLTLVSPVEKEGGHLAVLLRVSSGEIVAPQQRVPERTARIPRELSAIAMKALARQKKDRYPSVEALRRDIERFQEGRSVSAKEDSFREMLWKLVKRNLVASGFTVLLAVVVVLSAVANCLAKQETNRMFARFQQETTEKDKRTQDAVPALVRSARLLANDGQLPQAQTQLDLALTYQQDNAEARLVKGLIFIADRNWRAGRDELGTYLRQRPKDEAVKELLAQCVDGKEKDGETLVNVATLIQGQKQYGLAAGLLRDVAKQAEASRKVLPLYQKQIDAAWPGLGNRLRVEENGGLSLNFSSLPQVIGLEPLRGIPLSSLSLIGCGVTDLEPLRGMPLTWLNVANCRQVRDLTPLKGMPLTRLNLANCQVSDLTPLKGAPLTRLDLAGCDQVRDLTPLKGMRLTTLALQSCRQVSDLAPLEGMPLTSLSLFGCSQVRDLTPLKGMKFTTLDLYACQMADLTPLKGMPLTSLTLSLSQAQDLTPLKGMSLTSLSFADTRVADLAPLKGMPLAFLHCERSHVKDLTPLRGMRLKELSLTDSRVTDLTPLQGMELDEVRFTPKRITKGIDVLRQNKGLKIIGIHNLSWPAAEFWRRYDAGEFK